MIERPDGALVWGTFRPTKAEAWAIYEKWNPAVEGALVYPVEVRIFDAGEREPL